MRKRIVLPCPLSVREVFGGCCTETPHSNVFVESVVNTTWETLLQISHHPEVYADIRYWVFVFAPLQHCHDFVLEVEERVLVRF